MMSEIVVSGGFRIVLANRLIALGWALKGCKPCAHRLFSAARWLVPEARRGAGRSRRNNQSLGCDGGGGFTGVTTCGGSGVIVRSVVLASRLVQAGIATSMTSQRMCIDPRTLLRLPIGLCLQILDCRFSLRRSHLLFKTFFGSVESRVSCQRTFGASKVKPANKDQRRRG